ncbi:unnamed protein product [Durusdinium trenchii]|uniref:E3 ubiquitin-protein ligase synoviolin (RING-type E3 ubiquitin transferase synoviolin) (Synovial apoptosis inhibitor 1) n=2 Tax=Durusdinium trenchii TaxID=1381693 RepID=A0ABP0P5D2_9DINO
MTPELLIAFGLVVTSSASLWIAMACLFCRNLRRDGGGAPTTSRTGTERPVVTGDRQKKKRMAATSAIDGCPELRWMQEGTCAICLSEIRPGAKQLQCGHCYHRRCLFDWCCKGFGMKDQQIECPLCRQKHPKHPTHPMQVEAQDVESLEPELDASPSLVSV